MIPVSFTNIWNCKYPKPSTLIRLAGLTFWSESISRKPLYPVGIPAVSPPNSALSRAITPSCKYVSDANAALGEITTAQSDTIHRPSLSKNFSGLLFTTDAFAPRSSLALYFSTLPSPSTSTKYSTSNALM